MLDELVPAANLLAGARQMADHYAAKPPVAAQMIKASTNAFANALNHAIMHMDTDQNMFSASTEDRAEAIKAYLNNQAGRFSGN